MQILSGEYNCKLDARGRFLLPARLQQMMSVKAGEAVVVKRGFEGCLELYPIEQWQKAMKKLDKLNRLKRSHREFIRRFVGGACEQALDTGGRLILPKPLMGYAGIEKSQPVVLVAVKDVVEIWNAKTYAGKFEEYDSEDFANLSDEISDEIGEL